MRYIEFGENKTKVSEIALGLMRIADMSTKDFVDYLVRSKELGINFLDTADIYARGGSELKLKEAFKEKPSLRDDFFLQTKCGIRIDDDFTWYDFSKEYILEAVDASLLRLGVDHIGSLLLHRPDALMEPEGIAEAFDILKKSGKVKEFGLSNINPAGMKMIKDMTGINPCANQVQMSCAFTPMFDAAFNVNMQNDAAVMRDGGILEYCRSNDIVLQAWSVMQYGFFEGVFIGSDKFEKLNKVLERLAQKYSVTKTSVALAWILRYPAKIQTVVGTTKISRVEESAMAADIELTKKEWYEIYLAAGNILP